jgi:hypothetical protein
MHPTFFLVLVVLLQAMFIRAMPIPGDDDLSGGNDFGGEMTLARFSGGSGKSLKDYKNNRDGRGS